jgi:hypothetical protein
MESFIGDILSDDNFLEYFKKEIKIYAHYKKGVYRSIGREIINSNSKKQIIEILSNLNLELTLKVFGLLLHSYIRWKNNFNINQFSPSKHIHSKLRLIKKIKEDIKKQSYKVGFLVWGSFLMRKEVYSLFSDVDCVIIVDDDSLLRKEKITNFLGTLFEGNGTPHFNLPSKKEINWLVTHKGVARCGLIKDGIFVNFKILTKKTLFDSILKFTQSLKESNQGYFLIPDFNRKTQIFLQKNSVPVYPFVKDGLTYKVCRGLIPELLHTTEIIYANFSLKKELENIRKICIMKSMGFVKAYNPKEKELPIKILKLSYTPGKEIKNERKESLLHMYGKIYKDIKGHMYLETFLWRLYGELVLPLFEKTSKCWSHFNLLSFFLGSSLRTSSKKVKEAILQYFRTIKIIKNDLKESYIHLIIQEIRNHPEVLIELPINKKEKILLSTSLIDIIESFCAERPFFYEIVEDLFKRLFSLEYIKASYTLKTHMAKIGGKKKLNFLIKSIENDLKNLNPYIKGVKYRIRYPAGLYHHHLMRKIPLNMIDDTISIQILYQNKNQTGEIVRTTQKYLKNIFKDIKKRTIQIGRYKGYHFYFSYKKVPFEVMIRDLRSDISIEHKIEHSINQKKYYRLKF